MFFNLLKMNLKRCLSFRKCFWIFVIFVFLLILSECKFETDFDWLFPIGEYNENYGVLERIEQLLEIDTFKVIFVILLCTVYSDSYCQEKRNGYIRMILSRTDIVSYTQSKFIANVVAILVISMGVFFLYALVMLPNAPLMPKLCDNYYYYKDIMMSHPICYIVMISITFGMVAAACSSFGLLISVLQPDRFVSIGLPGLIFFLAVSFGFRDGPFDVYAMVAMYPTLSNWTGGQIWLDFIWGLVFSFLIICFCGYLFYRSLIWRMKNGDI